MADQNGPNQHAIEQNGVERQRPGVPPAGGPELANEQADDDVLNRDAQAQYDTPRAYERTDDGDHEKTLSSGDATLNTKT